ncbi:MAG: sensor histidine kinase [Prolixibacteraceae bacterium]|jgi:two-component system phosphate regulon sensor histidine kinase PhoR|nr:sensor histidine kinase [Prolixibacteraceae bacterium]
MKTYSAKRLSLYITVLLLISNFGFFLVHSKKDFGPVYSIVFIVLFCALSYFLVLFILNRYINEKIKPIYKTIREVPISGKKNKLLEKIGTTNISDVQKQVEEWAKNQTEEITRLKDLERYRKEFVGNVSHELKTPIFNIQGYVLTLLEGGIDDPKINKLYLQRTEKSIDRMISIVEDLESITKLESGELKINLVDFDLVKLTEDVFELAQMLANERSISLEYATKIDKPIMIHADKKRIMEVMNNLVGNGIKYGKKRGHVKVGFYDLHETILIEISDNGIGMDKNDLPRIFERFYRVDKSRSREMGGTGLGLSIVKHIIEAHDQTINVKSVVDKGTTFTFTLEKAK